MLLVAHFSFLALDWIMSESVPHAYAIKCFARKPEQYRNELLVSKKFHMIFKMPFGCLLRCIFCRIVLVAAVVLCTHLLLRKILVPLYDSIRSVASCLHSHIMCFAVSLAVPHSSQSGSSLILIFTN